MRCFIIALLCLLMPSPVWANSVERNPTLPIEHVQIQTPYQILDFAVEMATTPEQQRLGLMNRPALAADAGMLFVFPIPQMAAFWMRNTLIPLDMLFIDARGIILNIAYDTIPLSETPHMSAGPVRAVLEIKGGLARQHGIAPGHHVHHPVFRVRTH